MHGQFSNMMFSRDVIKHSLWFVFICILCPSYSFSAVPDAGQIELELKRGQDEQRFRAVESLSNGSPKRRLSSNTNYLVDEPNCWPISLIALSSDSEERFKVYLRSTLMSFDMSIYRARLGYRVSAYKEPEQPLCLGVQSIQKLRHAFQNELMDAGYTTTRVETPQQDLRTGQLFFGVVAGKLGEIKNKPISGGRGLKRSPTLWNVFPSSNGYLNLHILEQGIDNLSRLGTVSTSMVIEPGAHRHTSDVVVSWHQRKIPLRGSLSVDDGGSRSIGKYQSTGSVYWDNPLHLNDVFNISHTRSLLHRNDVQSSSGANHRTRSSTYAFSYSLPYKRWLFDVSSSRYEYTQAFQGYSRVIDYSGDSRNDKLKLSRLLFRNSNHKSDVILGFWSRQSKSYINGTEIGVQRRKNTGYMLGYKHAINNDFSSVTAELLYKKGWRHWGTIRAPEERFREGTSLMDVVTLNVAVNKRVLLGDTPILLNTDFNYQWNGTRLLSQDRFSIGGRHSIRGFAQNSLTGDQGFYFRNDATFSYLPGHSYYLGFDFGSISGRNINNYSQRYMSGLVVGVKGRFFSQRPLSYEFYISTPLEAPEFFKREGSPTGFNVSYNF